MEFLPASKWGEEDLESRLIEVVEAMIAPRSRLIGETLRSWRFREKYGVTVLAIWQWHGRDNHRPDGGSARLWRCVAAAGVACEAFHNY